MKSIFEALRAKNVSSADAQKEQNRLLRGGAAALLAFLSHFLKEPNLLLEGQAWFKPEDDTAAT